MKNIHRSYTLYSHTICYSYICADMLIIRSSYTFCQGYMWLQIYIPVCCNYHHSLVHMLAIGKVTGVSIFCGPVGLINRCTVMWNVRKCLNIHSYIHELHIINIYIGVYIHNIVQIQLHSYLNQLYIIVVSMHTMNMGIYIYSLWQVQSAYVNAQLPCCMWLSSNLLHTGS